MKNKNFLVAGITAAVMGTSANIAFANTIEKLYLEKSLTNVLEESRKTKNVDFENPENYNSTLESISKTLAPEQRETFIQHAKNLSESFKGRDGGQIDSVDEIYPAYLNKSFPQIENAYEEMLKVSKLPENTSPVSALRNNAFYLIAASSHNATKNIKESQEEFSVIKQSVDWKNDSKYANTREYLANKDMSENDIKNIESYFDGKSSIILMGALNHKEFVGDKVKSYEHSQLGYMSNKEDVLNGMQDYADYFKAVKSAGKEPLSPEVFFEDPTFKYHNQEVVATQLYLESKGVSPQESLAKSIVMVHDEANNFVKAKSLEDVDPKILNSQIEKYQEGFKGVGNPDLTKQYASYKAFHPQLNIKEIVEKVDENDAKLKSLSQFEKIKFMLNNAIEFNSQNPGLLKKVAFNVFSSERDEKLENEFNMKAAVFLTSKVEAIDIKVEPKATENNAGAPVNVLGEATLQTKSVLPSSFENFLNRAKEFFNDDNNQPSDEVKNKGPRNKF